MTISRRSLPIVFSLAGVLIFALAFWRLNLRPEKDQATKPLARVDNVYGNSYFERDGKRLRLKERQLIENQDVVETLSNSEALLTFANGEEVRVLENSLVLVENEGSHPVVILKDGDIWAEKVQDSLGSVLISRNGIRNTLMADFQLRAQQSNQNTTSATTESEPPPAAPQVLKPSSGPQDLRPLPSSQLETLSVDYIQNTLRSQRNLFFKCYTQLLQKSPGRQGDAALSFIIEKTGRVREAEVASTNLQDPAFKRCLTDAMKRVEFKSFAGDSVNALYPIRFE